MDPNGETKLVWYEKEVLGQGCQGTTVYGGHFGDIPVAVKRIVINNKDLIERELKGLQECCHRRIVHLYGVSVEKYFLTMILERCTCTLEAYCHGKYKGPIVEASEGLKQMLEGIAYIHQCNYVHRDVKPNNILVSCSGDLKIADFGFSKPMTGANTFSISNVGKGTLGWMAPELLRAVDQAESLQDDGNISARATPAIDIFPLGCVFYYFLTKGCHPFGNFHSRNLNILKGKYNLGELPSHNIYRSLIKHMIDADPMRRPDLNKVLSSPLFKWDIPSEELLRNEKKFNTWMQSLRNKFIINKEAKSKPIQYSGTLQLKDARVSPKRKSIFNASWAAPNGKIFEPLQEEREALNENNLSPIPCSDAQVTAFKMPAPRPKSKSVSEPPGATVTSNPRKNRASIVQRKLVASACLETEEEEERIDPPNHSKSMTNLFSLGPASHLSSSYSIQSLASSSVSTLGSIMFLGPNDDDSDSANL